MLSDDVFKYRLQATVDLLGHWLSGFAEVATLERAHDNASWRISVRPHLAEACPFELVLRTDQRFDLGIGPETYEDEPVTSLGLFQPVLAAIIDGRVITRSWRTAATDTLARIETIVSDAEHNVLWQRSRSVVPADRLRQSDFVVYDHCYAPYVRGA
jgi:hypothetical protein